MAESGALGRGLSSLIPKKTSQTGRTSDSTAARTSSSTGENAGTAKSRASAGRSTDAPSRSDSGDVSSHDAVPTHQVLEIDVQLIDPNEYQPRRYFREEELASLSASIKEHGVLQPITVTRTGSDRFELIAGERRLQASKLAGKTVIPAIVRDPMENQERLELALIENIQRDDLNAIEEALAYQQLADEFALTQDMIAKRAGKSRSTVANFLRLLDLPVEVQKGLISGDISEGHARVIRSVKSPEQQVTLFKDIVNYALTVRQAEERLKRLRSPRKKSPSGGGEDVVPDPDLRALQTRLEDLLGTQVSIACSSRGGNLRIDFGNKEDLNSILGRMAKFQ